MVTTALNKILGLTKKYKVIQGGQGAGKTFAILIILIDYCIRVPNQTVIIASAELTKMRLTVIKDFIFILKKLNRYKNDSFTAGTLYTFANGSTIKFIGLDQEDLGKGLRSDVLFINEANKCTFEQCWQLMSRAKKIYIDYNPDSIFWVNTEILIRIDADHLILTFKDNEYLSEEERCEILSYETRGATSTYWLNKWRVYGLGLVGTLDGLIFTQFRIVDVIPETDKRNYGMDFGFTNDPTALIDVRFNDGELWLDELLYRTQMTNADIIRYVKPLSLKKPVIADSSEPKSIEEIKRSGIRIEPAVKGPDSINRGIDLMKSYKINVTRRSVNLIKEFENYKWKVDRTGKIINEPVDLWNHCIDASRYAVSAMFDSVKHSPPRILSQ